VRLLAVAVFPRHHTQFFNLDATFVPYFLVSAILNVFCGKALPLFLYLIIISMLNFLKFHFLLCSRMWKAKLLPSLSKAFYAEYFHLFSSPFSFTLVHQTALSNKTFIKHQTIAQKASKQWVKHWKHSRKHQISWDSNRRWKKILFFEIHHLWTLLDVMCSCYWTRVAWIFLPKANIFIQL